MNNEIIFHPIAFVKNDRKRITDDFWSEIISEIILLDSNPVESLDGIESFSHLNIIYHLDQTNRIVTGSEHPRENPAWPKVGIFAQRKKDRPNPIGLTTVNLIKKEGRKLTVSNLDAIDCTPILDIKPVYSQYLPKGKIKQPDWSNELMKDYWEKGK
ncbi:MAG: SAM-dependent methyltransferase [Fidelibacterota bacterium]